jgi:hypothetical protein
MNRRASRSRSTRNNANANNRRLSHRDGTAIMNGQRDEHIQTQMATSIGNNKIIIRLRTRVKLQSAKKQQGGRQSGLWPDPTDLETS